jgi:hypothetical protein
MLPKLVRDHPVASRQPTPRKQALNCRSLIGKDFGYRVTDMKACISIAMLVSFFIVDAHRNEILLRYFGTPNDRSTEVNRQIVYARFFYDRTRV